MKRWIVLTATLTATHFEVYSSFATEDCESLALFDKLERAQAGVATIQRKWPYLKTFLIELDVEISQHSARVIA